MAFLLALSVVATAPGSADSISNAQNQRNQVIAQINQVKAQIAAAQNQQGALQNIINQLSTQIAATQAAIKAAQAKLVGIQNDMVAAQAHLVDVKAKLAADKTSLAQEMVLVYELSDSSTPLTNILNSSDINELVQRVIAARHVANAEQALTDNVVKDEAGVESLISTIASEQAAQRQVLSDLGNYRADLADRQQADQEATASLAQLQAQDQIKVQQMEQAEAQITAEIAQLQAEQAAAAQYGGGTGQFAWPLSGPITQPFGCTPYSFEPYDPNGASLHFHSGLDIAAGCGTPIHAAAAGIVQTYYTSYGYGNYIIMVNGNGWSTLYGHQQGFAVNNGTAVARGQVIGYEGSTGNSTGCHLHFEIRYNNVARNPLAYLP